jgi:Uma2 family endonuclease
MATQEPTTDELTADDQLHLGQLDDGRPTSAEEFAAAEFDEPWTYERVDGRLVVMAPDGTGHVLQSEPWRDRLGAYRLAHPEIVQVVVSQAWIHVDEDNTRIADIGVYLGGPPAALNIPDQVPDLVFEIVSPGKTSRRRDYVEKRAQYEKLGVREYVIIDRFDKKVTVLTLGEAGYVERVLTPEDVYRSPLLPGFEVILAEVLP